MRNFFTLLAALPAVIAAPILNARQDAEVIPNRWIAKLRPEADANVLSSVLSSVGGILGAEPDKTFNFGSFKGLAFGGTRSLANLVSALADIESIEPDVVVRTQALVTQNDATWGLARISHKAKGANTYIYDSSAGEGTFAYIIDTGIKTDHNDFGGRAVVGADFSGENNNIDGNGHGTHVAGTTGSNTWGVAKKTTLIAVKVLGADGSGSNSNVLAGIDWAVNDMITKGRKGKSVANLSLGGLFSPSTNAAANEAVAQGLFLSVAAGNSGLPTITSSPASAKDVCTVGATDKDDKIASFSNFGFLVDILAPGVNITSTWIDGPDDTNTISGTSMATPHITGLGAYLLGLEGAQDPIPLCNRIKELSTKGAIALSGLAILGTPNELAYNNNGA